jgi:hypothetical protein
MSAYVKKTERSQTNDLMLHLKLLEKQEENLKTSRREILKKRPKRINETKIWFFEKINKIDRDSKT